MSNPNHYRLKAKARRRKRCEKHRIENRYYADTGYRYLPNGAMVWPVYREICKGLRAARKAGVDCSPVPYNLTIEPMEKTTVVVTDRPCPPVFGHRVIEHPETCGDWGVIFDGRPGMEPVVYVGSKMYEKLKAEWGRKEMK